MIKNMFVYTAILSLFLSCQDEPEKLNPEPKNPLEGKVKTIVSNDAQGNKITTEWVYDLTTKQLTGAKIIDSLAKTTNVEVFKRDTDDKLLSVSIEKTASDGVKTQTEKTYKYNDKNQLLSITESIKDEQITDNFGYGSDGNLSTYNRLSTKNNRSSTLQITQYKWKQGNVSGITNRTLIGGYEEEDFQHNSSDNALAKLYKEELKLPTFTPEVLSQNQLSASVRLFEGSRYKYEYEFNKQNKLVAYKVLISKNGSWQPYSSVRVVYHE